MVKEKENYFEVKDKYAIKEHNRKNELMTTRYNMTVELIELKDEIATKRFKEKCELMGMQCTKKK